MQNKVKREEKVLKKWKIKKNGQKSAKQMCRTWAEKNMSRKSAKKDPVAGNIQGVFFTGTPLKSMENQG